MATKDLTKKKAAKNSGAETNLTELDPFAAAADPAPAKKRASKTTASAATPSAEVASKPLKRKAKTVIADPFADVAAATLPVKKGGKTTVKATAKRAKKAISKTTVTATLDVTAELASAAREVEVSPVFKALADVALPELKRENRARLQMQTPTRLYFYWSIRENPWATLRAVFGEDLGSYSLVVKLIENKHGREEITQCEAEGNWWFDVEPDGEYKAEIGFYAPNRPYFRILYSNIVETPRRGPSPRVATEADWTVSSNKFAEVLDVAGFSQDAFEVALAGDDHAAAEAGTHAAFASLIGAGNVEFSGVSAEDIRYAMLAIASGATLEDLRWNVSPPLFAILQANAGNLDADNAKAALGEHFDIDETEFVEEQLGAAVYGASRINFPRTLKKRAVSSKYNPVSSHSVAR